MQLHKLDGRCRGGYTTFGCVWEKGEVKDNKFALLNQSGEWLPVQSTVAAYWPDRSIKWSTHTANSDKMEEKVEIIPGTEQETSEKDDENVLVIDKRQAYYEVNTGKIALKVPLIQEKTTSCLANDVRLQGELLAKQIYPVFQLENRGDEGNSENKHGHCTSVCRYWQEFKGEITEVTLEQEGPLQAVFCFKGNHVTGQMTQMPFVIRMYLWKNSEEIRFVHTFLYDGVEATDFLKGMGIRLQTCIKGKVFNRHVQFATDGPQFAEAAMQLFSSHPRVSEAIYYRQQEGIMEDYEKDPLVEEAVKALPIWNRYSLLQDSAYHYQIRKQTDPQCCLLTCRQGKRAPGVMTVTGETGGIMLGIRDFWQKCPSGLEVDALAEDDNSCTAWFYSPEAEAYDFRHYDTRSYPATCYEGFDYVGADAVGIAVTSECCLHFVEKRPSKKDVIAYGKRMQKPCVYVGEPEYYHKKRAFGYWSLPQNAESAKWFEEQLEKAFLFYQQEVENRDWYGLFDYGDVMHTYDKVRHVWRYDVGGFAWQNTELVPTYWLWLYFLRTGREEVFTLAEAMTRHCSEVDIYHFGKLRGLGSRHNVRHWGCSCKEPRISMAGHQRFLYYFTGDLRLGDVMDEVKDADITWVEKARVRETLEDGREVAEVRSGPDWSSFVSNWMTAYERTLDTKYLERIRTGIADIAATPFGLASGPDYFYDADSAHLIYHGEIEKTPNQHLQICMGGVQVWLEVAMMLEDDRLNKLLSDLGAFYLLNPEEKAKLTNGLIKERAFSWSMFATSVTAYSAMRNWDVALAKATWEILCKEMLQDGRCGFDAIDYAPECDNYEKPGAYTEIPWVSTNLVAQWCLNVIMCLEFIPEFLSDTHE